MLADPQPEPQAAAAAEGTVVRSEAELVAALQKGDNVCLPPSVVIELGKALRIRADGKFSDGDRKKFHCEFRRHSPCCQTEGS